MILRDITASVGKTPMVELARIGRGLLSRIVAKLEMRNPCGSVKDRVGVALIDDAEHRGALRRRARFAHSGKFVGCSIVNAADWTGTPVPGCPEPTLTR